MSPSIADLTDRAETSDPRKKPTDSFVYVDLSAIDQTTKGITGSRVLTGSEAPSRARQLIRAGDVLVSTVRPNLNAVAIVPQQLDGATASTGFCVLRPRPEELDSRFLFHFVRTDRFVDSLVRNATGASYPAVSEGVVRSVLVPVTDLQEQRRIADVLDRADELRSKRRAAMGKLESLKRSIFLDIFGGGSLPPVWPAQEQVSHPAGWRWELLMDYARLATGHTPDRNRPEYWGGNIPWITTGDIRELDGRVAMDTRQHISDLGEQHSSAVQLPVGTICFSRTASVGFVTMMGREMATSQDFVNWVCGPDLNPTYLLHAFLASRNSLRKISDGSTHKTIYFPTVERFRVLIPPRELQDEFVRRVGRINPTHAAADSSVTCLTDLAHSLQERAFSGRL